MTHSELLTPGVSECPSPLGLEFLSRESLGWVFRKEARTLRKNQKLSYSKIAVKL